MTRRSGWRVRDLVIMEAAAVGISAAIIVTVTKLGLLKQVPWSLRSLVISLVVAVALATASAIASSLTKTRCG